MIQSLLKVLVRIAMTPLGWQVLVEGSYSSGPTEEGHVYHLCMEDVEEVATDLRPSLSVLQLVGKIQRYSKSSNHN